MAELPFVVGALYSRSREIHEVFGGQRQGGISTPANHPIVIAFTGEAGKSHGYNDFWDDAGLFHYYGEGQRGDMKFAAGNRAVGEHQADGKKLVVFQMMGRGKPYRYLGEFLCVRSYIKPDTPATEGPNRNAIVFCLRPLDDSAFFQSNNIAKPSLPELELGSTVTLALVETRKTQSLFRRRLLGVEKACRLTGVQDLRFLVASHIKPWAKCNTAEERIDGHNGVLLTPHADHLFDRGWITFEHQGALVLSSELPGDVKKQIGLNLKPGRNCGHFTARQRTYLDYHREAVFEKRYRTANEPIEELVAAIRK